MCPGELVLWFICWKVAEKGYERDYILNFNKPLVKCSHSSSTCRYKWGCMNTLTKIPQALLSTQEIRSHTLWEDCLLPYTFLHPQIYFHNHVKLSQTFTSVVIFLASFWINDLLGKSTWSLRYLSNFLFFFFSHLTFFAAKEVIKADHKSKNLSFLKGRWW